MSMRSVVAALLVVFAAALVAPQGACGQLISGIDTEGNEHLSRDRILLGFGLRIGEELKPEDVREGIRRLYDMGHFSDILVTAEPQADGSVRIIVVVEERPKILAVEVTGNDRISENDIREVLKAEPGAPYDASRLEDSRVAVAQLYERKGFPYAKVEVTTEQVEGNRVDVTIAIDEGIRVVVKSILFDGNDSLEANDLKKVMDTKEDRW